MSLTGQCRKAIQKIIFGNSLLPQAFTREVAEPQTEITVWLHGMGAPIDVTHRHSMACADPFTVCLAFDQGQRPAKEDRTRLSLKFCEQDGRRVLGEISLDLKSASVVAASGTELVLFQARSSRNYCLPKAHILAHYLRHRYLLWRKTDIPGRKMSFLERRAVMVMFIRPHPVVLLSLSGTSGGNIFPMNIMGDLGSGYFAFALKEEKLAAHLVEQAGRVALSNVPIAQTSVAYQLGANHRRQAIDWHTLPFAIKASSVLHIPVPSFALHVREMEIKSVHRLGSHMFFVAQILSDERVDQSASLCIVHGFYQAWRLKGRRTELETSLAQDVLNKRGLPRDPSPV
jgi:flavin reductase (DIM6/NTAB) family NADH-FMN oxidoreductase RutF